ncbi:MAG: lipopolysaccharide biosynthesis protein, partial [Terriglobales bacterium]
MSPSAASGPQGMPGGAASLAGAKRRFSFNAACNVAGFLTQIVSAFVVTPIVVHGLGNLQYGIWGLIGQTVTSMDLLDFGLGIAVTRFLAHHHARDDRAEMGRMVSTALAFSILPVCIMLLGGAGLAWMAPRWFHTPAALDREVRLAVMLIAAAVAAMVPGSLLGSAVPALSRYDLLTLRNTFWIAVRAVLYWLILRWGYGLVGMAGVTLAVELLALGLGAWLAHRLIPWLRLSWRFVSRRTLRPLLTFSGFAFLLTISTRVIFGCDNIVVGWALGPLAVAFYAVAGGLADQLRQSTKILTTLYSALATQIHALEGSEAMQRLFLTGSRLAFLLVLPGCIGLVLLGPQFLQLWLGAAYRQHSSAILVLLTLTVASFALATSCTQILYGMNRHRYNAAVSLLEAAANLGLSIGLVRTFGAVGVAWGTAVPAVVFEAVVLPLVTVRQVHLSARAYYDRVVARPLWVSAPLI